MELGTRSVIGASLAVVSLLCRRGLSQPTKSFCLFVVLSLGLPLFGLCSLAGIQLSAESDACGSNKQNYNSMVPSDMLLGGNDLGSKDRAADRSVENVCSNSGSFCFPSTLPGFLLKEREHEATGSEYSGSEADGIRLGGSPQSSRQASNLSWSLDHGLFGLLNGKTLSCSLSFRESSDELSSIQTNYANQYDLSSCRGPLVNQKSLRFLPTKESDMMKSSSYDASSSSPHVEISAPALDWGQKYLYSPSVAFLTVTNTDSDRSLHVYEPFSTDNQFYPCNFSEVLLRPGEEAAFCFVFLPIWLGLSSAHLVLQTSFGGFLVQAKGFAMKSPYGIQPLSGLDESSSGRWIKNLSLFNPFDEMLNVEEVTAWISVSSGNSSHYLETSCSVEYHQDSDKLGLPRVKNRLILNNGQGGWPLLAMSPHRSWEIDPQGSENIIELDFSAGSGGKTFGVFCMQLRRSSKDQSETVMVPLEGQVDRKATYDDLVHSTTISIEGLAPFYVSGTVVIVISLRNRAPYLLNVVEITEVADTKLFDIKYMEGLLLYPGTSTEAGIVACSHLPVQLLDSPPDIFNVNMDCKLHIRTNDSNTPQIEIPCQDMINICAMHQRHSSVGYEHQSGNIEVGNSRTRSFKSNLQFPSQLKVLEATEADERVLANWKSQGTSNDMSVLQHREVLFPLVQVGNHYSMWITVNNPSLQPIVMQLILNSGEIVDECRDPDGFVHPPSSGTFDKKETMKPTKYGFSIAANALTEAYVQPHGRVSFGPILFHPSSRCRWRSSVLIRNNLSGVEWISLRGYGGSLSLVLFEGLEPVQKVDFDLNLLVPFNLSSLDMLVHREDAFHACSQSLSKELYAKNTGDLPLEVRRIEVSGTKCGMNGFIVHTCKGFALEPGESIKFLISYQTDFSAIILHRDLELSLATGMFVIPMKASLPAYMFNLCNKSIFWAPANKVFLLLAVLLMVLVFCCIFPQVMASRSHDSLCKSEESSVHIVSSAPKSSPVHCNKKTNKLSVSSKMDDLRNSVEYRTSVPGSLLTCHEGQSRARELGKNPQYVQLSPVNQSHTGNFSNTPKLKSFSFLSNSGTGENFDIIEASKPGDLIVRIGKEKGRRRRKRKGAVLGLTGSFEVSSSQSGTSTPSSPLSPVSATTPKQITSPLSPDVGQSQEFQNSFVQVAELRTEKDRVVEHALSTENKLKFGVPAKHCRKNLFSHSQEQVPALSKMARKPVLLPSATFPCVGKSASSMLGSPSLASTFRISPHARAPGSNLDSQKIVNPEEKPGLGDEYRYDIWGNRFSGIHLKDGSMDLSPMISNAKESESDSFFVRGPQTLMTTTSQPRSSLSSTGLKAFGNLERCRISCREGRTKQGVCLKLIIREFRQGG